MAKLTSPKASGWMVTFSARSGPAREGDAVSSVSCASSGAVSAGRASGVSGALSAGEAV